MTNATIRDVAHTAGVSVGTVSNFLNDTKPIAPETRRKIEETIARLGFVPNNASRVMRGHRSLAIGLVVPDSPDPFFTDLARGVEDKAREAGYVVVGCNTDGIDAREVSYVRALTEMRVTGAIVMPTSLNVVSPHLQRLTQSGGRFVLLGERVKDIDACTIAFDDFAGGHAAATHLLSLGHRDILFVGGPGGERQISERLAGARAAFEAAGLDPFAMKRIDAAGSSILQRTEVGDRILALPQRPTAVFCANDSLALAVQGALLRRGVLVPDDISIVGYNNIDQTQLSSIPVTTISTPRYDMGALAASLLLAEFDDDHQHSHTVMDTQLIVRESTTVSRAREERGPQLS